jgi:wyosine [tRNA(Phe)-imidazoG37] synthetase (radical SAM superfamily)
LNSPDEAAREYLKTRFCANPFRQLETAQTGLAYVCCPVWLPTPAGKLDSDAQELWRGKEALEIRESFLDGSFRFCNHVHCPSISGRTLPSAESPESKEWIRRYREGELRLPEHLVLSHDKSCNLSCPSCRSSIYMANSSKQKQLDELTEKRLLPLMQEAKSVMITGSGDPFGSKHFRNLITRLNGGEFPGLTMDLISNGQLWDERGWFDLKLDGRVRYAQISVDAAQAETYAIVRRGGQFERLLKNLAFIRRLRLTGKIAFLELSMVVQALNYREMPAFVRLGEEFGADKITFNMIRQRDIFSQEEFLKSFIGSPDHPEHEHFREVLLAPELNQPNVQIGNVREYAG